VLRTISFEIVRAKGGAHRGNVLAVTPCVDGASLATLVEAYERAKGYHPAGGYGGLIPAYFTYDQLDKYITGKNKSDYWMSDECRGDLSPRLHLRRGRLLAAHCRGLSERRYDLLGRVHTAAPSRA
jgi:hypothetical protein